MRIRTKDMPPQGEMPFSDLLKRLGVALYSIDNKTTAFQIEEPRDIKEDQNRGEFGNALTRIVEDAEHLYSKIKL